MKREARSREADEVQGSNRSDLATLVLKGLEKVEGGS